MTFRVKNALKVVPQGAHKSRLCCTMVGYAKSSHVNAIAFVFNLFLPSSKCLYFIYLCLIQPVKVILSAQIDHCFFSVKHIELL